MKDIFLLDLDDTLLDFSATERVNLQRTFAAFSVPADKQTLRLFHEINDRLWKALERGEITRQKLIVKRFGILSEALQISLPTEEIAKAYFAGFEDICIPFAGALGFVKALAGTGRVFIVTNGAERIQTRHIADAGFAPYLSGTFISEQIGFNKPDVRFAEYVDTHIQGFERSRAVWLGDSLTSDMLCAKSAGIDFILYAPQGVPAGYEGSSVSSYEAFLRLVSAAK